ncbi:hypothetical protein [Couchioplanes caeruleus]|uniref:Uncharacterized protein n=2 Tax=Couchioplanes caeruleus TaxID=56438 RepID=A0A1K0FIW8_9ACTN|nr:hypothetical protein [Couchioplanes caeruleus]OJF12769.1 hypothetical protein BG844_18750 [Couchioplanes caeruleus subsp. caeruleus]ROP29414.1 hypothetical protein EDD30_2207 [Couchioplanes caeruleus]
MIGPRLAALTGLGVTLLVAVGLAKMGLPTPAAVTGGLTITGWGGVLLSRRLGRACLALGLALLTLSVFSLVAAFSNLLGKPLGITVALAVAAAEAGLAVLVVKALRLRAGQAAQHRRAALAAARGWQFAPTAEVPVAGPETAGRLVAVANDARSTTGSSVLTGTADGVPITVFDRSRAGERGSTQTVWALRLPFALPYFSGAYLHALALQEQPPRSDTMSSADLLTQHIMESVKRQVLQKHGIDPDAPRAVDAAAYTDDPGFAEALTTASVRAAAGADGFPPEWWIEGDLLYAVDGPGAAGAAPDHVSAWTDQMAALIRQFPWPALEPYRRPAA